MPPLCPNVKENSDDEDDNDWEEMEEIDEKCLCLFCDETAGNVEKSILHLIENHKFDLSIMKDKFQMDQYSYIMVKIIFCFLTLSGFNLNFHLPPSL
jgi:hypothetical protein